MSGKLLLALVVKVTLLPVSYTSGSQLRTTQIHTHAHRVTFVDLCIIKLNSSLKTLNSLLMNGFIGSLWVEGGGGRVLSGKETSSCHLITWPTWELCTYFLRCCRPLTMLLGMQSACLPARDGHTWAGLILSTVDKESWSSFACVRQKGERGGRGGMERGMKGLDGCEDEEFGKSQLSVRLHVENLSSSCLAHKNGVKHRILPSSWSWGW